MLAIRRAVRSSVVKCLAWLGGGVMLSTQAFALGTPANTPIVNTASVTYSDSNTGDPGSAVSNTVTLRVDEILGVTVVSNNPGPVTVTTPGDDNVLSFTVSNPGNGPEAYRLAVDAALAGDQFDPTDIKIFLDSNGNGIYDPGVDVPYVAGSNDPLLNPDQSIVVFVTGDTPAGRANNDLGSLSLSATAVTGSGTPGTSFPGQGVGGVDAVVGPTTARAAANGGLLVNLVSTSLVKSQVVTDARGGSNPVPGSVITYSLLLSATGSGLLNAAAITDDIPANSSYVPGSLTLGGAVLTDAADGDAGRFTGSGIEVNLGNLTPPVSRTVTFRVRIN